MFRSQQSLFHNVNPLSQGPRSAFRTARFRVKMKSILILLGLLFAAPHSTVKAQIRRPVSFPIDPPIRPIPSPPNAPSIYSNDTPTSASYSTNFPTAASVYSTNYPTATGNPHPTSNFSLSRTLPYPTSRVSTSTRTSTVTIVPPHPLIPRPAIPPHGPTNPRPPCQPNTLICNTLTTWSLCAPALGRNPPRAIYMGRVAAGTVCRDGEIVRGPGGDCSPVGRLTCAEDGQSFFMCDEGGQMDMGPVARGTECIAGNIYASEEEG